MEENLNKYIHIHADCIPVRGAKRAAFYDLTRHEVTLFPSDYYDILPLFKTQTLGELLNEIETEEEKGLFMQFLDFLIENEFILFLEDTFSFPPIQEGWEVPSAIQNAIIDVNEILHDFDKIFQELDALGCEYVQIRSFSNQLKIEDLDKILSSGYHKSIQGVELLLKYDENITDQQYIQLIEKHLIIYNLILHTAPVEKELIANFGYTGELNNFIEKKITFVAEAITSQHHCGVIDIGTFSSPNVGSFFENKLYNGCLNKKISVDSLGEIKNCPSMPQSYGNIKNTSLIAVLGKDGFKNVWNIHKDQIDTCKECEFRYICTDCRAYQEEPNNLYSKPLKCGYNPHTAEWEDWSANPLKEKVMMQYMTK